MIGEEEIKKIKEKAQEVDSQRQKVLQELYFAREKVVHLEALAHTLGKKHLRCVDSYLRLDRYINKKPPERDCHLEQKRKTASAAIREALNHMDIDPENIPDFFKVRAVVFWWIHREMGGGILHLFHAWKTIVGQQEKAKDSSTAQMVRMVERSIDSKIRKYKSMLRSQVLSETHQEHQESKEPCQPHS